MAHRLRTTAIVGSGMFSEGLDPGVVPLGGGGAFSR